MKLQLDTEKKTIKLEDSVGLGELIDTLEKLLPNGAWRDFTIETNTNIEYWGNPIIIKETNPIWVEPYPRTPWITYDINTTGSGIEKNDWQFNTGVYNIEIT